MNLKSSMMIILMSMWVNTRCSTWNSKNLQDFYFCVLSFPCHCFVLERWIFKEINFIRNILYKHFTLHKLIHEVGIHLKESNYHKMNVVMNILIYSSVVITQSQVFHKCSHQCKKKEKKELIILFGLGEISTTIF